MRHPIIKMPPVFFSVMSSQMCLFFIQEHLPSPAQTWVYMGWVITRARAVVKHVPVVAVGPVGSPGID